MASATWTCPSCKRRVPNRAPACHCGTTREEAERATSLHPAAALPSPRRGKGLLSQLPPWSSLTWDLKALVIALGLVVVLAVVWLFVPSRPQPIHPVLGFADQPPPKPSPTPSPTPSPKHWKLPWSR